MDLLSGDDYATPEPENSLALVPVSVPPATPSSQQNILSLSDMFSHNNSPANSLYSQSAYPSSQTYPSTSTYQQQQSLQPPQSAFHSNGSVPNSGRPQYEQAPYTQVTNSDDGLTPSWNGQSAQGLNLQQQALIYGTTFIFFFINCFINWFISKKKKLFHLLILLVKVILCYLLVYPTSWSIQIFYQHEQLSIP